MLSCVGCQLAEQSANFARRLVAIHSMSDPEEGLREATRALVNMCLLCVNGPAAAQDPLSPRHRQEVHYIVVNPILDAIG